MEERKNMKTKCPYCSDDTDKDHQIILSAEMYPNDDDYCVETTVGITKKHFLALKMEGFLEEEHDRIPIIYCPMCGRKLV